MCCWISFGASSGTLCDFIAVSQTMDHLSSMTVDEICGWLTEQDVVISVVESFAGILKYIFIYNQNV